VLTLYQTEWCPFSSAVREVMTELGLDFVCRQVEPWPAQRERLREIAGTDLIPVLETEDGRHVQGTRRIFDHLRELDPWRFEAAHRRRFAEHRDARETEAVGQLLEYFRGTDQLEAGQGDPAEAVIRDVPEQNHYELRLDDRLIGLLAYRRRPGRIALTHTEVEPACSGRGFGSRLVETALGEARKAGLQVLPLCPFVARYIDRHPEYAELVAPEARDQI
jgi:uncharacterized protein